MSINYEYRSEVLNDTEYIAQLRKVNRSISAYAQLLETGQVLYSPYDIDTAHQLDGVLFRQDTKKYVTAQKIISAQNRRISRLKRHLKAYLNQSSPVNFLTFTFAPETLEKTNDTTRRKAVTTFLKSQCKYYIANKDYGGKNGREHYHAVVVGNVDLKAWDYGIINVQTVANRKQLTRKKIPKRYKDLDAKTQLDFMKRDTESKLAKYVAKLSNHAVKNTTKRSAIIYSKKQPVYYELLPCDSSEIEAFEKAIQNNVRVEQLSVEA